MHKYTYIFIFLLFLIFSIRFIQFGSTPVSLYWDEVAILVDAKAVSTTGKDMHGNSAFQAMFPSYGDYKLPAYIWLTSVFVKVLGPSEFAVRLPSLFAGVLTVLTSWKIFQHLLDKKRKHFSLIAACVVTVLPWSFIFSRTAFEGHLGQSLLGLSIYLVLTAKDKKGLVFSILIGALSVYAYFSVRFVWPILFLAELFLKESQSNKKHFDTSKLLKLGFKAFISFTLFTVLLLPLTLSPFADASDQVRYSTDSVLKNDEEVVTSNKLRELSGDTIFDRLLFHRSFLTGREVLKNYSDLLSFDFLFLQGDPNLRHGTGQHGILLLSFAPFLFWGMWTLGIREKKTLGFLLIWWLVALLPAAIPNETPHALRSLNALIPISLLISFGLLEFVRSVSSLEYKKTVTSTVFAVIIIEFLAFTHFYFNMYPELSSSDWQDNYAALANAVVEVHEEVHENEEFIHIEPFDDRFYLWLLAHDNYTGEEFTQWESQNFRFTSFENITTNEPFDWSEINDVEGNFTIAGEIDHIEKKLSTTEFSTPIRSTQVINDSFGKPQFLLVQFGE